MNAGTRGLLVLNLGTPDSPQIPEVKKYLAQFLMDPFVIDIPYAFRWLLIHGIILRTRPAKSAHAYQSIWTTEGSPLLVNTQRFADRLKELSGETFGSVKVGMRYGNPSINSAIREMVDSGVRELTVFSMYPQYAESSFRTGIDEVKATLSALARDGKSVPTLKVTAPYYAHPEFIESYVALVKTALEKPLSSGAKPFVLMSFHGLPQRHLSRLEVGPEKICGKTNSCCEQMRASNANCYRAQSFETARQMAKQLGLKSEEWAISFQSRLGPGWIQPFTDEVLPQLPAARKKDLVVVCPSFTSDCLETLEEMGIRGRKLFMNAGGRSYTLVACLNDSKRWVQGAAKILESSSI